MGEEESLLGVESGTLDFGERRLEQRLCHLGGNLLIGPHFLKVRKSFFFLLFLLTESLAVSQTNNVSDKYEHCHHTLHVAVAPE